MTVLAAIVGTIVLLIILWDGFEVIILPRRVARRLRLSRLFYLSTWAIWSWLATHVSFHQAPRTLPELLRTALAAVPDRGVGHRHDACLRHGAVVRPGRRT